MKRQRLDQEDIRAIEALLGNASKQPLLCGMMQTETHEEIVKQFAEVLSKEPGNKCWAVWYNEQPDEGDPTDEGSRYVAVTGNGPTSKGNAEFFMYAQRAVFELVEDRKIMAQRLKAVREVVSQEGENGLVPRLDEVIFRIQEVIDRLSECIWDFER